MPARKKATKAEPKTAVKDTPVKDGKDKPLKRLGKFKEAENGAGTSAAAAAPPPDHLVAKIRIEHCKSCQVFKRKAQGVISALSATSGLCVEDLEEEINPEKPRRGAFEVTIFRDDGKEVNVWSGIKKGPPRKLKFPEPEDIVDAVRKAL